MSFPWNLPLDLIEKLVSSTLAVSGLLVGSASFLLGLYLPQAEKMAPKRKLMSYVYLEASLVTPALVLIALACTVVIFSCQELWLKLYLLLILIAPVVPAIAVICILLTNRPIGGSLG